MKRIGFEKLLTIPEIAEILKFNVSIVKQLIKSGEIKTSEHKTKQYLVEETDLKKFIKKREIEINIMIKEGLQRVEDEYNEYVKTKQNDQ